VRPSPFAFARAVTEVVCNPTMGNEKRCCRRAVSSFGGAEDVRADVTAVEQDAAESLGKSRLDDCGMTVGSSVEECEAVGLGVTWEFSSWKFSRTWRNERGRDAGRMRTTG